MPVRLVALALGAGLWYATRALEPSATAAWLAPIPAFALGLRDTRRMAIAAALLTCTLGGLALWPHFTGVLHVPAVIAIGAMVMPAIGMLLVTLWLRALARRHPPWLAAVGAGALAATIDLLAARLSIHGSFGSLAYTQLPFVHVVQLAAFGGTPLLVFVMTTVGATIALGVVGTGTRAQQRATWALSLAIVAATIAIGTTRLGRARPGPDVLRVALLATDAHDVPPDAASPTGRDVLARYDAAVRALPDGGDDVVVLPERIVDMDAAALQAFHAQWSAVAQSRGITLVLGASGGTTPARNAAWTFAPDQAPFAYAKRHLLPPFESRFTPGDAPMVIAADAKPRVGVLICKDADFAEWGRRYASAGIAALLVPSWDFGADGWLHARMAMLRGIEGGYAVVRPARRGRLTVSDAWGRVLAERRSDAAAMTVVRVALPVAHVPTVYARVGDAFGAACMLLVLLLLPRVTRRRADEGAPPTSLATAP